MTTETNIHKLVEPIAWLIGNWHGKHGVGIFPTIKTFIYNENLVITHPEQKHPILHFKFTSWFEVNGNKTYSHSESGYLKVIETANEERQMNLI